MVDRYDVLPPPGRRRGRGRAGVVAVLAAAAGAAVLAGVALGARSADPGLPDAAANGSQRPSAVAGSAVGSPSAPAASGSAAGQGSPTPSATLSSAAAATSGDPFGHGGSPSASGTTSLEPLLQAPDPAPTATSFAYLQTQEDSAEPVTFSPCRELRYVIRPDGQPRFGAEALDWAIARISEATGLRFVYEGPTDEAPREERSAYQPDRYGQRWVPILVAWSWAPEMADLEGPNAAVAGPQSVLIGGVRVAVSGQIALDAPQLRQLTTMPGGVALARAVVLHELAHVVGLGHVPDRGQLMYPQTTDVRDLQDGDLAGLWWLGRGPCLGGDAP
ncbi:MAG: matrixin family metalloprotease [Candidatus Nanopelagicales bacterium]